MNRRDGDLDPGSLDSGDAVDHLERLLGDDPRSLCCSPRSDSVSV